MVAAARHVRAVANTIRGKILLAFCALATITGFLGLYAVSIVVESGRLVVETYDRPLMSISYARLALADFTGMQLALAQRQATTDGGKRSVLDLHMDELGRSLNESLGVAEERASSARAATLARNTAASIAAWNAERHELLAAAGEPITMSELERQAAGIVDDFDALVEQTAADGFKDRARALASIERYRQLSILATVVAFLLSALIAILLAGRMVRPIAIASRAARRIAAGELEIDIEANGRDELGELLTSMATMRDNIRAMMEREIAARRSAQGRLVNAIESSTEGVALADGNDRVLIANSQMRAFFPALTDAFAAGTPLPPALDPSLVGTTGEIRLPDGRWLRLSRSGTTEDGFVIIAGDITTLKEREAALHAAKEQAEAADLAKTEFLANMSHELRTPLNAVIGFSEIIATEMFGPVGTPRYKDFAGDIMHSGRHLLEIINDILDIAKLQSGKTELAMEVIRIDAVIAESLRMMRPQAETGDIVMIEAVDPQLPAIAADATRLRQVLLNLLSNAIKFTPPGGMVTVSARRQGRNLCIAVSDTGIGMRGEDIPRALEPFVQIDSSFSRRYAGTGLGLPLSKLFAELHAGRLTVESAPGRGTTVTVTLPLASGVAPALAVAV
jgi:signal transduction histidine kinase/HAMP domain-containing protein